MYVQHIVPVREPVCPKGFIKKWISRIQIVLSSQFAFSMIESGGMSDYRLCKSDNAGSAVRLTWWICSMGRLMVGRCKWFTGSGLLHNRRVYRNLWWASVTFIFCYFFFSVKKFQHRVQDSFHIIIFYKFNIDIVSKCEIIIQFRLTTFPE